MQKVINWLAAFILKQTLNVFITDIQYPFYNKLRIVVVQNGCDLSLSVSLCFEASCSLFLHLMKIM